VSGLKFRFVEFYRQCPREETFAMYEYASITSQEHYLTLAPEWALPETLTVLLIVSE
jgi:hypothetical protein